MELVDLSELLLLAVELGSALALGLRDRHLHREVHLVREEFVKRRVEQPDGHRQPVHRLEDADEVLPLERQQRVVRALLVLRRLGEDHLAHGFDPLLAEEHVLGATQTDALRAALASVGGLVRGVGVRANAQAPCIVGVAHQAIERLPDPLLSRLSVARSGALEL